MEDKLKQISHNLEKVEVEEEAVEAVSVEAVEVAVDHSAEAVEEDSEVVTVEAVEAVSEEAVEEAVVEAVVDQDSEVELKIQLFLTEWLESSLLKDHKKHQLLKIMHLVKVYIMKKELVLIIKKLEKKQNIEFGIHIDQSQELQLLEESVIYILDLVAEFYIQEGHLVLPYHMFQISQDLKVLYMLQNSHLDQVEIQ